MKNIRELLKYYDETLTRLINDFNELSHLYDLAEATEPNSQGFIARNDSHYRNLRQRLNNHLYVLYAIETRLRNEFPFGTREYAPIHQVIARLCAALTFDMVEQG